MITTDLNITEDPNATEVVKISNGKLNELVTQHHYTTQCKYRRAIVSCSTRQYSHFARMHVRKT
jgi:hypothetical protein